MQVFFFRGVCMCVCPHKKTGKLPISNWCNLVQISVMVNPPVKFRWHLTLTFDLWPWGKTDDSAQCLLHLDTVQFRYRAWNGRSERFFRHFPHAGNFLPHASSMYIFFSSSLWTDRPFYWQEVRAYFYRIAYGSACGMNTLLKVLFSSLPFRYQYQCSWLPGKIRPRNDLLMSSGTLNLLNSDSLETAQWQNILAFD